MSSVFSKCVRKVEKLGPIWGDVTGRGPRASTPVTILSWYIKTNLSRVVGFTFNMRQYFEYDSEPSPGTPNDNVLRCVHMNADVYQVCLQHALSTEKEEVMGLLIGEIDENKEAHISAPIMLRRSDKRKDRVEISPEQLSGAAEWAEKLAEELNRPMRVIGWYHSHPHITVWPSHVDVRTQLSYQMLDEGFVGIIFSVFSEDKASKEQEIQVTCFQSVGRDSAAEKVDIDLYIVPTPTVSEHCLKAMVRLPEILVEEERETHDKACHLAVNNILSQVYNNAELTKAMCHITELVSLPLFTTLDKLLIDSENKVRKLQEEKEYLLKRISEL